MLPERRHQADPARVVLAVPRAEDPAALLATLDELEPHMRPVRMEAKLAERIEQGLVPLAHRRRLQERVPRIGVQRVVRTADPIEGLCLAVVREQVFVCDRPSFRERRARHVGIVGTRCEVSRVEAFELRCVDTARPARAAALGAIDLQTASVGATDDRVRPPPPAQARFRTVFSVGTGAPVTLVRAAEREQSFLQEEDTAAKTRQG